MSVVASEVGWSTCEPRTSPRCCAQGHSSGNGSAVRCLAAWFSAGHKDEETQARLLARQFLVDALAGLELTIIYDYRDDWADAARSVLQNDGCRFHKMVTGVT